LCLFHRPNHHPARHALVVERYPLITCGPPSWARSAVGLCYTGPTITALSTAPEEAFARRAVDIRCTDDWRERGGSCHTSLLTVQKRSCNNKHPTRLCRRCMMPPKRPG